MFAYIIEELAFIDANHVEVEPFLAHFTQLVGAYSLRRLPNSTILGFFLFSLPVMSGDGVD